MSDANIYITVGLFGYIQILSDSIFSICHRPVSYFTDAELDDVEEII